MSALLAILKESFWSTYKSKVLHLSVGMVLILILALFPFGYKEKVSSTIFSHEISRTKRIFEKVDNAKKSNEDSLALRFWNSLDEAQKQKWNNAKKILKEGQKSRRAERRTSSELAQLFNQLIENETLNEALGEESLVNKKETKDLISRKDLLDRGENSKRLGKLLISETFGRSISSSRNSSCSITYGWAELPEMPLNRMALEGQIREIVPFVLDKFVLSIGLLIAVVITASIIPQMLESGSLYLLLSKPVSRMFLLFAKFLGSTIFVLIFSSILLGGCWLILGLRFQIWIPAILWSVLVYVIIFMVYYSVTMGVGLVFRNTIAAIMVTIVFWAFCFVFSISNFWFKSYLNFFQSEQIACVGDLVYRKSTSGQLQMLDKKKSWADPVGNNGSQNAMAESFLLVNRYSRPVLWQEKNLALTIKPELDTRFRPTGKSTLFASVVEGDHTGESFPTAPVPNGVVSVFLSKSNQLLAVSSQGSVYHLVDESILVKKKKEADEDKKDEDAEGESNSVLGSVFGNMAKQFQNQKKEKKSPVWKFAGSIALEKAPSAENILYDQENDQFFVLTRHVIYKANYSLVTNKYQVSVERKIPWNYKRSIQTPLGLTKNFIVFPLRLGTVAVLEKSTLEVAKEFKINAENPIGGSSAENDRFYAVAYGKGGIWVFDEENQSVTQAPGANGYNCTSADFNSEGNLVFGHGFNRLSELNAGNWTYKKQKDVDVGISINIYDWFTGPLYSILPKPSECYKVVSHLAKRSEAFEENREDNEQKAMEDSVMNTESSPYSPVISSVMFAMVVMAFNCLYFGTREF